MDDSVQPVTIFEESEAADNESGVSRMGSKKPSSTKKESEEAVRERKLARLRLLEANQVANSAGMSGDTAPVDGRRLAAAVRYFLSCSS